jgi:hypothetical protein
MKTRVFIAFLFVCFISCSSNREENVENEKNTSDSEMTFDKEKWRAKDGKDYLFRDRMLNDIAYNDSVRSQNKIEILDLLGEPDRSNENHLYYLIAETRLGFWPLHTKTLVIKFSDDSTIDWIRIHE